MDTKVDEDFQLYKKKSLKQLEEVQQEIIDVPKQKVENQFVKVGVKILKDGETQDTFEEILTNERAHYFEDRENRSKEVNELACTDQNAVLNLNLRSQLRDYIIPRNNYQQNEAGDPETRRLQTTKNTRIVYFGILVCLICIYTGVRLLTNDNLIDKFSATKENSSLPSRLAKFLFNDSLISNAKENLEDLKKLVIVERLLEHKDICYDMEIFRQDLNDLKPKSLDSQATTDFHQNLPIGNYLLEGSLIKAENVPIQSFKKLKQLPKDVSPKHKIGRQRRYNKKNGNGKYKKNGRHRKNSQNESNGSKNSQNRALENFAKEKTSGSRAEPIIYCFALAFIYLLMRAISDINEHYKEKKRNQNRARRCSLQSYAQINKQNRRASKDVKRQKSLLLNDGRASSVDRFCDKLTKEQLTKKSQLLRELRKYASFEEQRSINNSLESINIQTQLLKIEKMSIETRGTELRRGSLNFLKPKLTTPLTSPLTIGNTASFEPASLSRRTSLASGIGATMGVSIHSLGIGIDSIDSEGKRRVRMINRH